MSIDRWNRNDCKYAFLNAKNCTSTAERQEAVREFCIALWYDKYYAWYVDDNMVSDIAPYLVHCAKVCNDEYDFAIIADAIRNAYRYGKNKGYENGYHLGFNVTEDEERG